MQIKLKRVSPTTLHLLRGAIGLQKLQLERRLSLRLINGIERQAIENQITELNDVLTQLDQQQVTA